jgi:hypothetical protein
MDGLRALGAIAENAKRSYHSLATATAALAAKATGDAENRDTKFSVSTVTNFLSGIASGGKGGLVGFGTDMAKDSLDIVLAGSDFDSIVRTYENGVRQLADTYRADLEKFENVFNVLTEELPGEKVLEPLPPNYSDVHSTSFDYINFQSDTRPPDRFGPKVDKIQTPEGNPKSDITIRLNPEG